MAPGFSPLVASFVLLIACSTGILLGGDGRLLGGGDPGHLVALVPAADPRLIRGQAASVAGRRYVESCSVLGISRWRIIVWHVLPSTITPLTTHNLAVASELCGQTTMLYLGEPSRAARRLLTAPTLPTVKAMTATGSSGERAMRPPCRVRTSSGISIQAVED